MQPTLKIHKADLEFVKPQNGDRILQAASAAGINLRADYQCPQRVKRAAGRLDIAALIRGDERPCWRDEQEDGSRRGGVDVFFQCALMGAESQVDVDRRALGALAYAVQLQSDGVPVSLYACWISQSTLIDNTYAVGWAELTDISIGMLAGTIDEDTFRHPTHGVMAQRPRQFGSGPFGSCGGNARTIKDANQFAAILRRGGIAGDNAVILDWNCDNEPVP